MRDRASYIEQARGIGRRTLWVLGFNGLLWILLVASGGMARPTAHASPVILSLGLASALIVPTAKIWPDRRRKDGPDYGLHLGLIGTTLLWGPLYLLTMFGEQPDILMDLVYVGAALMLGSVFWPTPAAAN